MRRALSGVNSALASWARGLLRPLAGDQAGERFWQRHVRVGVALSETSAVVVTGYVLVADRPHRDLLLAIAVAVIVSSPLLLVLPAELFSSAARGSLVFYLWSTAVTAIVALISVLDGGADSPLLWLLVLTMTFAALAYPPPGVVLMGGLMVVAYLVVVVVDSALGPATVLVAVVLLSFTVMSAWISRNHWWTYEQQVLLTRRLAELDRTREEFVATTSHELRTPVASILGYVELLEDAQPPGSDPHRDAFLPKIRRNAERLQGLSEDLLVLFHWDAEQRRREDLGPDGDETDLVEVAGRVCDTMTPLASRQRIALVLDGPSEALPVTGSADQLERVLLNLVSNAVKYTPAGGHVTCRLAREGGEIVVEVSDDGIGIAADEVERLFSRFFRASSAREQSIAGVGLGLSIVREIVTLLGGSVEVSSRLGAGTTFLVRLPPGTAVPTAQGSTPLRGNHSQPSERNQTVASGGTEMSA